MRDCKEWRGERLSEEEAGREIMESVNFKYP